MNKESFLDLLDRYQQNKCSDSEKLFVEQWYESLNGEDLLSLSSTELSKMSDRVLLRLHANMQRRTDAYTKHAINWRFTGIAASVTIAMLCSLLYAISYNNSERAFKNLLAGSTMMVADNNSDTLRTVMLSDRSRITLQPHARLSYPTVFSAQRRTVYLKGDAFFAVSKNHKKPFYVYNNNLVVKVLGTSFFVKEAGSQVSVRTGKVQVNENTERKLFAFGKEQTKGVLVTPNQKAIFDTKHHQINKMLVDVPLPLSVAYQQPDNISFNFNETSLKDIFAALSKAYGISLVLEDENISGCTFTGDIAHKGLHEQLNLICQSISGSYSIKGTTILIKGKNCN